MVRVASSSDEAARVWHAGFGRVSERRKQATSICRPTEVDAMPAQLLHGGPLPQRRDGGHYHGKPGTASKTPRFNWRHCCGAVALSQLRTFSRLEQKLVVVSARCRGLHAVIIEMACSCIDTDSSIEFPGASQRKAHDPIICVDNFRRHGRGIPTWSVTPSILISWPKPLFFVCTNFIRCHQNK